MAFNHVTKVDDKVMIRNVIVSVYDKTGLEAFVVELLRLCPGVRFFATGGTYAYLSTLLAERAGAHLVPMTDYTGQPEMKGGLVKTLDWKIYLGLLAEPYDAEHEEDLAAHKALVFDMVIGNLYPFKEASARASSFEEARQNIDIGGPSMMRAAAKNFLRVAPVCGPDLYPRVAASLEANHGALTLVDRALLAGEAYRRQSAYDAAVAAYFAENSETLLPQSYS